MSTHSPALRRMAPSFAPLAAAFFSVCAWGGQPPVVGEVQIAPCDTPLTMEPVTLSVTASSPDGLPLTYVWDFGDGSAAGTTSAVEHVYPGEGIYIIGVEVSDGVNPSVSSNSFLEAITPPPADAPVGVDDGDVETNPDNGLSLAVQSKTDGFVELTIDTSALSGAAPAGARWTPATTVDWGLGGAARNASSGIARHKFDEQGIFPATVTVKDADSGTVVAKARKSLVMDATALGQPLGKATAPPPADKRGLVLSQLKGKFNFKDTTKYDMVQLAYALTLPQGFNIRESHDLTLSVGNVKETVTVDPKGKGAGAQFFKKVQVKYPRFKDRNQNLTEDAETAAIIKVQMKAADMSNAGFDTEGITNRVKAAGVMPSIQMAVLLEGVGYSDQAAVEYKLTSKTDKGAFSLPRR